MADKFATIVIKNSSTPGAVPSDGTMTEGELAINTYDKKGWVGDAAGDPVAVFGPAVNTSAPTLIYELVADVTPFSTVDVPITAGGMYHIIGHDLKVVSSQSPVSIVANFKTASKVHWASNTYVGERMLQYTGLTTVMGQSLSQPYIEVANIDDAIIRNYFDLKVYMRPNALNGCGWMLQRGGISDLLNRYSWFETGNFVSLDSDANNPAIALRLACQNWESRTLQTGMLQVYRYPSPTYGI